MLKQIVQRKICKYLSAPQLNLEPVHQKVTNLHHHQKAAKQRKIENVKIRETHLKIYIDLFIHFVF